MSSSFLRGYRFPPTKSLESIITVKVSVVIGTRPEAIKMAPVIRSLRSVGVQVRIVLTGQHSDLVNDLMGALEIWEDVNLCALIDGQSLSQLLSRLFAEIDREFENSRPDCVLVQGDTSSALAGALAAFNMKIPVGHVEAGLRSGIINDPFPEEMNRKLISTVATMHFAPTAESRENLILEGVPDKSIWITGNTVIDNLMWSKEQSLGKSAFSDSDLGSKVLLTMHRRENQGRTMICIAEMLLRLSVDLGLNVVLPIHPSPRVRESLLPVLSQASNIRIVDPLDYFDFIATLSDCDFVLTDSGGVQEEAPAFNKPVLVLRETTERPEGIQAGCAELVGINPVEVEGAIRNLVTDADKYREMASAKNPYGDGLASRVISEALVGYFSHRMGSSH